MAQAEIARDAGLSRHTLYAWQTGRRVPLAQHLHRLADGLEHRAGVLTSIANRIRKEIDPMSDDILGPDMPESLRRLMQDLPAMQDHQMAGFVALAAPGGEIALAFTLVRQAPDAATEIDLRTWGQGKLENTGTARTRELLAAALVDLANCVGRGNVRVLRSDP